jgi:hypothetical protein
MRVVSEYYLFHIHHTDGLYTNLKKKTIPIKLGNDSRQPILTIDEQVLSFKSATEPSLSYLRF